MAQTSTFQIKRYRLAIALDWRLNLIGDKDYPLDLFIATAASLLRKSSCFHEVSESALVFDFKLAATIAQQTVAIITGIPVIIAQYGVSQAGSRVDFVPTD